MSKKAVDMANLRLAMSENNKKVKECVQSSEKTLQDQVDELKESAVTPEEKALWKNQNAFSVIIVEGTKVEAQDIADTLALTAGDNVSLVPDPNTKQIVIKAEDTKYTHPESGVSAGTYKNVTVDEQGHVVAGDNPTTLAGYGITDAEKKGTANSAVSAHNTAAEAHSDIRLLITELTNRLNALANSDDETLDQTKEIVAYIKANRELIESITTSKVNVTDIINNLTTNVSNKPLSAAQGVAIKALIDALQEIVNGLESVKHVHSNSNVLKNTTASYTTEEKTKLSGVEEGANNYSLPAGLATGYITTGQRSGETLGEKATAEGNYTTASGNASHAEGNYSVALGDYSHAEGGLLTSDFYGMPLMDVADIINVETTAYSTQDSITQMTLKVTMSNSVGLLFPQNIAYDKVFFILNNKKYTVREILYPSTFLPVTDYTVNLTLDNPDNVDLSSSFNKDTCLYSQTIASGQYSHAEGQATTASGKDSHAEGSDTTASGVDSHAEGYNTTASGYYSHAEGSGTIASSETSHAEGYRTTASGKYSHAEGSGTQASGQYSHTEGHDTTASGEASHAEGGSAKASGVYSHAEGSGTTASGKYSHAEGTYTLASGDNSHAEGNGTQASGNNSHAEGYQTTVSGNYSHAEGYQTTASGSYSHAEGNKTIASGTYSHAEGGTLTYELFKAFNNPITNIETLAYSTQDSITQITLKVTTEIPFFQNVPSGVTNKYAFIFLNDKQYIIQELIYTRENFEYAYYTIDLTLNNPDNVDLSSSFGMNNLDIIVYIPTIALGSYSHAEGHLTTALGSYSHAEGDYTTASASSTHAEGRATTASGHYSHAEGQATTATNYASHVSGKFNKTMTNGGGESTQVGDVFVIGNGTGDSKLSNAFRVTYTGATYGLSAFNSSGADYAEFIYPWYDDNKDDEDRIGYFVTFKDGKLYKATSKDIILGITSGNPSIVGNADEDYYWKYERDEFSRIVFEDVEEEIEKLDENGMPILDENGKPIYEKTGKIIEKGRMKLNPNYDPSLQNSYIERKDRKEWDYVGMLGVLPIRDDGTCIPGQFCKCNDDGIATLATAEDVTTNRFTFIVLERVSDNVIKVKL